MPDIIYHEYMNRVLKETNPASWESTGWKVAAISAGLSDYFPCSYLGEAKMGQKYVELAPADAATPDMKKRGYLRDMLNKRKFVADTAGEAAKERHEAGEVWSGVFWDIRTLFGCANQTAKCADADRILLMNWKTIAIAPAETIDIRFARAIIDSVKQLSGTEQANNVRTAFTRRGMTP
jgi:hypothetical protein